MNFTPIKPVTWDVLETATGARLQSLIFAITTAGFNKEGICYEQRDYAIKVLRNFDNPDPLSIKDDSYFALIYTLDPDDDPLMRPTGRKQTPVLGFVNAGMTCAAWRKGERAGRRPR